MARVPDNTDDRVALNDIIHRYAGTSHAAIPWTWVFPTTGAAIKARERLEGIRFAVWRCGGTIGLKPESVPTQS